MKIAFLGKISILFWDFENEIFKGTGIWSLKVRVRSQKMFAETVESSRSKVNGQNGRQTNSQWQTIWKSAQLLSVFG